MQDYANSAVNALIVSIIRESSMWALEAQHHEAVRSLLQDIVNCGTISGVLGELYIHYPSVSVTNSLFTATTAQLLKP